MLLKRQKKSMMKKMSELLVVCSDCGEWVREKHTYTESGKGICYNCIRKRNKQYEERRERGLTKWL